jgi:S-DNA-T family DNA segregation ATPase FtsK/SpoIIIE
MRHPSTVKDNGRIGIGLFLLLVSISGFFHLLGSQPAPSEGEWKLAYNGGLFGWLISWPFLNTITVWGAVPVMALISIGSVLIMSKTSPTRIGERLAELKHYLFGAAKEKSEAEPEDEEMLEAFDGTKVPWWRRSRDADGAFEKAVLTDDGQTHDVDGLDALFNQPTDLDVPSVDTEEPKTEPIEIVAEEEALSVPVAKAEPAKPLRMRPYVLPANDLLTPGTPPKAKTAVKKVVSDTLKRKTSPPKGSSKTSPMLKAMVPKPTASNRRKALLPWLNIFRADTKSTSFSFGSPKRCVRASCFHKAVTFKSKVATAAACTELIRVPGEKSLSK